MSGEEEPILQPRLVRLLKNRPKLIGGSVREDILEEIEKNITERRKPDRASERVVGRILDEAREASMPVMKGRVKDRMNKANEGVLNRL